MNPSEVRAKFNDAVDAELSPDEQRAFDEALTADSVLRDEYAAFRAMLLHTRGLARSTPDSSPALLAGVQHKLRVRSRGRFYRDRFAERSGRRAQALLFTTLAAVLLILGLVWALFHVTTM